MPATTASASAMPGTAFGLTNETICIDRMPTCDSASISAILRAVSMGPRSYWKPSRGPSSLMWMRDGRLLIVDSIRLRQAEHVVADIGKDQVGRDRRDARQPRAAPLALDVVLARDREAAVRLHAFLARCPGRLRTQQPADVGLFAARLAGVEQRAGRAHHQVGGPVLRVATRERELDALVLTD